MAFTDEQKSFCAVEFAKLQSVVLVQRKFRAKYRTQAPTDKTIHLWYNKFKQTGSLCDAKRSGRPGPSKKTVSDVQEMFTRNPLISTHRASQELGISQSTVWRIVRNNLHTPVREGLLLGLGNPLLDISANTDANFLQKYDLKPNDAILAEEKHHPMYNDLIENFSVDYTAGGACQNSMRVAQWMLQKPNVAAFMGCIGKDSFGKTLESKATEAGVLVSYQYHDTTPTGTCAVVVTEQGAKRSLCANLSAANCFSINHLDNPANKALFENAKFYYITGFFLTVSPPSIMRVAKHASANDKPFCMNLSAPFLSQFFKEPMMEALPYVDILFGNEQEAATFSEVHNFGTKSIEEIALRISDLPKENKNRPRITIITQGKDPVVVAKDGKISIFEVPDIKTEDIIDTNGAGDAFVGGFLAQYIQDMPLELCVKCGMYTAGEVIKLSGCTLPEKPNFIPDVIG